MKHHVTLQAIADDRSLNLSGDQRVALVEVGNVLIRANNALRRLMEATTDKYPALHEAISDAFAEMEK